MTAPLDRPLAGVLEVTELPKGWRVDLGRVSLDLPPGGVWSKRLPIRRPPNPKGRYGATATLTREGAPALVVRQPFML